MKEQRIILVLGIIFIFGAPLYSLGYITLGDFSIFGFSLGALLMSISSLLDNPLKKDSEQHILRKIAKNVLFILSIVLIVLSPMLNTNITFLKRLVNSIDSNVFLLYSIGFSFFTLFVSDLYKKQVETKIENEKNKAVTDALNKYDEMLKKKFQKKED
ncbi:hypothetical protein [Virgibacillus siamensis]|uniref:hypothetical protein n=1 Tax=Virgibacillus siamensis TaxID=480071 RepID=UPI0009874F6E|nr:hypothetical protein [Virgibacillus siamensis]